MTKKILDVRIDDLSKKEALTKILVFLAADKCRQICTVNPEFLVEAQKNPDFQQALNQSDLNINDSFGLKIFGRLKNRVPGADFVFDLFELSQEKKFQFYFLGGKGEVAKKAAEAVRKKYPKVMIAGAESGGEIDLNNLIATKDIINRINQMEPDILLVAFGSPKQEIFINFWQDNLKCKVAIGVGASLDFIAGVQKRAPKIIRTLGLEWFWRLLLYPARWRRIFTAVFVFPYLALTKRK